MGLAIKEAWEIGLIQSAFDPGTPLCLIFWCLFAAGAAIQWPLLKKAKRAKYLLALFLLCCISTADVGVGKITGFEGLAPLFLYWFCLAMLLGVLVGWIAYVLHAARKK